MYSPTVSYIVIAVTSAIWISAVAGDKDGAEDSVVACWPSSVRLVCVVGLWTFLNVLFWAVRAEKWRICIRPLVAAEGSGKLA